MASFWFLRLLAQDGLAASPQHGILDLVRGSGPVHQLARLLRVEHRGVQLTAGLDAREQRDAEFAALLHDIGKIKIPGEIINKPGKLTDEEYVATGRLMPDDEYLDLMRRRYGFAW